jgi:tetratricopeptide (TPR) repeat protein
MLAPPAARRAVCQETPRQVRDRTIREAQSLTRYGNNEMALELLERLYAQSPTDEVVVVSFFDFLVEREMYERARGVMEEYLDFRPTYVGGMAKLADLYFKMGENEQAEDLLERFIETGQNRAWAFEMAAQTYINAGMMDEALLVVERGRAHHQNPYMLHDQAAQAYLKSGRYAEAVSEYLTAIEGKAITGDVARSRIIAMAREPAAREAIVPVLERAAEDGVAGLVPLTALWQMSMAEGDCAGGLADVTRLVRADRNLIGLLVNAAGEFERGECFGECADAYGLAAELTRAEGDIPGYLLARGMCQERGGDLEGALATYEDFSARYSGSERGFDGFLGLARCLRAMGRCEEALAQADRAVEARARGKDSRKAVLIKGDCLVILGRFDDAKRTYDLVRPDWDDFQAQSAYYNLGEIALYEHDLEAALSYFNVTVSEYPGEALANDAVERLILIRGARAGEEGYAPELGVFAEAALSERQGEIEEAITLFRRAAAAGPSEVRVQSLKNLIRLYLAADDLEQALDICKIAGETVESHWSPVALETAGDIYLRLGMLDDAVNTYENVIVNYPNSVSAGEARRKLDLVRRTTGE